MSSVRRATFLVILERVVLILAGMSVSIILARMLGPAGMGEWKLLMSVQNTSMYVLGLGLTFVVMRYTAEFIKDQRFDAVADILFRSLAITLIVIIVTGGSYLVFIKTTDLEAESVMFSSSMAIFIVCVVSLNLLNDIVGRAFFTGLKRRDIVAIVQMTGRGFFLVAVLIAAVSGFINLRLAAILLIAAYSIELGFYTILLLRRRKELFRKGQGIDLASEEGHRIAGFAGYQWLFRLAQLFREYSVDNYMLLMFRGVESVGIYGAAVTVPALLRQVSPVKMFSGILIPLLVPKREHINDFSYDRLSFSYKLMQKITAISVWPMAVLGVAFAHDIIVGVFGESFSNGVPAMQILIGFMVIQTATDIFYTLAIVLEESRLMFVTSLWGIVNVVINFALIPAWGVTGAAIGTGVISIGIYSHFRLSLAKKGWEFSYPLRDCLKVVVALIPLIVILIINVITSIYFVYMLMMTAMSLGVYLWCVRQYSPFNFEEKELLVAHFGKPARLLVRGS